MVERWRHPIQLEISSSSLPWDADAPGLTTDAPLRARGAGMDPTSDPSDLLLL